MKELLQRLLVGETLTRGETKEILLAITRGEVPAEQIAAWLTATQMRGVTVDELLGLRDGVLATGVPVTLDCDRYIDIVGTGGDGKNTFNISTCACFVVAGAGYKVVKHGNYASTSVSGASNVIEGHGVRFTADVGRLNRSLSESGVVYLHAPLFASALKHVGPIRKALQFPTCFNLLGPLVNPAQPPCQLLGTATLDQLRLYSNVYQRMGVEYGIVNSVDGYDEISLTAPFKETTSNVEKLFSPADLGMPVARPENLYGGSTLAQAVDIFDSVLENRAIDDRRNVVIANAACAIGVLEPAMSIMDTVALARESLESGRAMQAFKRFVEINSK